MSEIKKILKETKEELKNLGLTYRQKTTDIICPVIERAIKIEEDSTRAFNMISDMFEKLEMEELKEIADFIKKKSSTRLYPDLVKLDMEKGCSDV